MNLAISISPQIEINTVIKNQSHFVVNRCRFAILFVGDKGNGKSKVVSELLKKDKRYSFITDEIVLVYRRTLTVEPFPRAVHGWKEIDGVLQKHVQSALSITDNIQKTPSFINRIIFLEPTKRENRAINSQTLFSLSKVECAQKLMLHSLDTGTDYHESLTTLMNIAKTLPCESYTYFGFDNLLKLVDIIVTSE